MLNRRCAISFLLPFSLSVNLAILPITAPAQIDEIIVTAQMREQVITEVPVAVTSLNSEFIELHRIRNLEAVGDVAPGLIIQEQSANNPGYVIRGISTDEGSPVDAARISLFLNGADISRNRASLIELYDLERIEVIKGPQATLFGTAASGGAISVNTALPQREFASRIQLETGNFGYRRLEAMATGGFETLQGRLAFMSSDREGYGRNIGGDNSVQQFNVQPDTDLMARQRFSIRPSLSYLPDNRTRLDLVLTREQYRDSGTRFKSAVYAPAGGDTNPYSFSQLGGASADVTVFNGRGLGVDRNTTDFNLRFHRELDDDWTLNAITNYRSYDSIEIFDADGSQAFAFELGEEAEGSQVSQEIRLQYQSADLTATLGGTFFEEEGTRRVPFATEEGTFMICVPPARVFATQLEQQIIGMGGPDLGLDETACINPDGSVNSITPLVTPFLTGFGIGEVLYQAEFSAFAENSSWSVFLDTSWTLSSQLELVAGLRYVDEDRSSAGSSQVPNAQLTGGLVPLIFVENTNGQIVRAGNRGTDTLPRLALNFRPDTDTSFYLSASKGRRAAVTDVTPALDATTFAPLDPVSQSPAEILWNYEAGFRGKLANNRLYVSAALFSQDYENFQIQILTQAGQIQTTNAGSATNQGLELELRWQPSSRLETFLHLAHIDAGIDDKAANGIYAGRRFRLQPENTAALGYQWRSAINGRMDLVSSARASYRGDVFFSVNQQPVEPLSNVPLSDEAVTLVNFTLGIADPGDSWRLELFAENLTDENYLLDAGNTGASVGLPTYVAGSPRFWGLSYSRLF